MSALFLLPGPLSRDPAVAAWFAGDNEGVRALAADWFARLKALAPDVTEILHDHCPTACVADAAFAYVAVYARHAAIGFFHGVDLPDPQGLLEGGGKRMRHVKLHWGESVDEAAVMALTTAALADIRARLTG